MAKRGLNIYQRKDKRWEGRYRLGFTRDGKPKYVSVYGKSYSAVKEILERKRAEYLNNTVSSCNLSFGRIAELWLSDIKNKVKESTLSNYVLKLNKHVLPYFSGLKYERLTAENINSFINVKLSENLSVKYVSDIVILIKSIAKFARKQYGCVDRIEYVTLPKNEISPEKKLLNVGEQSKLWTVLSKSPTNSNVGIMLSMTTGIRIGELCALKWENIDLEKSILTVSSTMQRIGNNGGGTRLIISSPKSTSSVRKIPIPDVIIPYLKSFRADNDCFLLSGSTKITEPRTMQYRFKSLLKKAGLPYVSFHALRHMFATDCIALGFDVKTLSEILGHSSVEITLNRYVHSSMERKINCMKKISDSFVVA